MLAIRMQRVGRSGHAQFRMVVQDSRFHPSSGRVVAYLGNYDPHSKQSQVDKEKLASYLANGAQPSPRVVKLLKKEKIAVPAWVKEPAAKNKTVKNADKRRSTRPAEQPKAETPAEEPAEEAAATEPAEVEKQEAAEESPTEKAETQTEAIAETPAEEPAEPAAESEPAAEEATPAAEKPEA